MDILVSSNLERLIYHLSSEDSQLVAKKMEELKTLGYYSFKELKLEEFYANYAAQEEVEEITKRKFNEENYLLDPHTAVAYRVYEKYKDKTGDDTKTIILATASPFKFPGTVLESLGSEFKALDEFELNSQLSRLSLQEPPRALEGLKTRPILHRGLIHK